MNLEQLKYPIGQFEKPAIISTELITKWIAVIEEFPVKIKNSTNSLSKAELNLKYRPNGWNIKQVVHHCADSHMNAFIRFKLALTEENPTIKPYNEAFWAELIDGNSDDITSSIQIIEGVHAKWGLFLKNFTKKDFNKILSSRKQSHLCFKRSFGVICLALQPSFCAYRTSCPI